MRKSIVTVLALLGACMPIGPEAPVTRAAVMGDALPPMKTFAGTGTTGSTRPNSEIAQDFLDLAFRMESGRTVPVMTRFEGPISVRVTGDLPPSLVPDLRSLLNRLRSEAAIDIFMTGGPLANITVEGVTRDDLNKYVPRAACFVVPRVSSWAEFKQASRTAVLDWTTLQRRDRAAVFIPTDTAPQEIRDCLHEELAQGLGPLNDLYRLPDSVFNDDNINAVLTSFDMLVLRAYYSADLRNGMTRADVAGRLPAVLARLNPGGERSGGRPRNDTPRDWITSMETALTPGGRPGVRRQAAERALNLGRSLGYTDNREGFALYAYGRLNVGSDSQLALGAFRAADAAYRRSPETRLHTAHVAVQLAAFALNAGDSAGTLRIVNDVIPVAQANENAALLATLMMFKAEALKLDGRTSEAEAVRLDSLGWARYGFGSETNVRARLREVAALAPRTGLLNR